MKIEWSDEHSVGIESLDRQHKALVGMTNDLFKAILEGEGHAAVKSILEGLAEYVSRHFPYEEQLLDKHGYPADMMESHMAKHRELLDQLYDLMVKYNDRKNTIDLEVFDFLRDWMTLNLSEADQEYALFLREKGVE